MASCDGLADVALTATGILHDFTIGGPRRAAWTALAQPTHGLRRSAVVGEGVPFD